MTAETLTVSETINAWVESQPDATGVKVWSYSPNGGDGGPAGETDWGSEDWVCNILQQDWDSAETEADTHGLRLKLQSTPERSVHQYYELYYCPNPEKGRDRVAYLGAHAGFCWEGRFSESGGPAALEQLLDYLQWDDAALAPLGLATCEDWDNGDDAGYWLVGDGAKFAVTLAVCRAIDRLNEYDGEQIEEGRVIYDAALGGHGLPGLEP